MAASSWRVIAQRVPSGEFLHWDLPLREATTSRELSGPGGVFGNLSPRLLTVIADDGRPLVEEWSTALYVEEDGQIRGGGIVETVSDEGPVRTVSAPGFTRYPSGIPHMDNYVPTAFEDPITIWKKLWAYVQSFPDSDLGVRVIGAPNYQRVSDGQGPYKLVGTDYKDVGDELNNLAAGAPFDFQETHSWADGARSDVRHDVTIGFPRLGRRQDDMRFATGENIESVGTVGAAGEAFANDVTILGPGEGLGMLKARAAVRDGRLRRCAVIPVKDGSQGQLTRRAADELRGRGLAPDLSELVVRDTPHARIAAIDPGDDILVNVDLEWRGQVRDWFRVLAIQESGDRPDMAVLKLQRSDSFSYASATSPNGQPQLIIL